MQKPSSGGFGRGTGRRSSGRPKPKALRNPFSESEAEISKKIADFLEIQANSGRIWHTRLQSGLLKTPKGHFVHLCRTGTPDRIAVIGGKAVFFEVKKPSGRVSVDQAREHERLRTAGALVFVVRSVAEVQKIVTELLNDHM